MKEASAFSPGHVTGFFEVCRSDDLMATGSRGAGLCLSLGATSKVEIAESSRQSIVVAVNGKRCDASVTKEALRLLIGAERMRISVATQLDLPISQGFGMSAAGALSAAIAACSMTKQTRRSAFEAVHIAEIVKGGGLGDVSAISRGGITIRRKAGLPPIGDVVSIDGRPEVVLCVVGRPMLTKSVLGDPRKQKAINSSGSRKVDELLKRPTLERLMSLSSEFASESGLASGKILEAMSAASKLGTASMSMLGNSVFAVGDTKGLERVLSDFGRTYTCVVDTKGPRLL